MPIAEVQSNGAILLGKNVVADGYARRPIRVVTHAHQDHIIGLRRSTRTSLFVVATPTTLRFLEILGFEVPEHKRIALTYGKMFMLEDEVIRLLPARHIAGSAQVLVDSGEYRVAYTGDFKMPGTVPIRDLDVLVIDATYGNPRAQRRWSDWEALMALVELIDRFSREGPVWVYGYNGKLQEVMVELRKSGIRLPFYADSKTVRLAMAAAEFYGVDLGDVNVYTGGPLDESAVVFAHSTLRRRLSRLPGKHLLLTGWEMRGIVVQTGPHHFNVSYSDHATLREILEYIGQAKPRMIIVDAYRGKDAQLTARYLERVLGIPARAFPRARGVAP